MYLTKPDRVQSMRYEITIRGEIGAMIQYNVTVKCYNVQVKCIIRPMIYGIPQLCHALLRPYPPLLENLLLGLEGSTV